MEKELNMIFMNNIAEYYAKNYKFYGRSKEKYDKK